jgi:hypothetical protein
MAIRAILSLFGKQDLTGSESRKTVLASTRLYCNNYKNKQPQQMILGDLRVWLLISYNVARSLEGYDALRVIRAEEETDDPESKGNH